MLAIIVCGFIALAIFVYPRDPAEQTKDKVGLIPSIKGFVLAALFLLVCGFFGVFDASNDSGNNADAVTVNIQPMATEADANVEPLAFVDWLHARPDRANDSGIVKSIDRALAPPDQELDIAHAKPYRIVHTDTFPSKTPRKRRRLYVYAPQAVTPLQRAQTAILATLEYSANDYKRIADGEAWEIDLWLVAYPEKISTYSAMSSYYKQGVTYDGRPAPYVMQVQALDLPYSEIVKGENYAADMRTYLTIKLVE